MVYVSNAHCMPPPDYAGLVRQQASKAYDLSTLPSISDGYRTRSARDVRTNNGGLAIPAELYRQGAHLPSSLREEFVRDGLAEKTNRHYKTLLAPSSHSLH